MKNKIALTAVIFDKEDGQRSSAHCREFGIFAQDMPERDDGKDLEAYFKDMIAGHIHHHLLEGKVPFTEMARCEPWEPAESVWSDERSEDWFKETIHLKGFEGNPHACWEVVVSKCHGEYVEEPKKPKPKKGLYINIHEEHVEALDRYKEVNGLRSLSEAARHLIKRTLLGEK